MTERKPSGDNRLGSGDDSAVAGSDQGVLTGVAVSDLDANSRQQINLPDSMAGALITSVDPSSAAAQAGLHEGDVILEINRHKVDSAKTAIDLCESATSRRTLLKLWSHGSTVYVVVNENNSGANDGSE